VASKLHGVDVDIKIIKRKGEPLDPVEKLNDKINIFTSTTTQNISLDNQSNLQQQQTVLAEENVDEDNIEQSYNISYTTIDNDDDDKENCRESGNDNLCQYQNDIKIIKQCKNCLCIKTTSSIVATATNGSTNNVKCEFILY
jgi:hypothetical protein